MTAMRRGVMEHMRRSVDTAAHVTSAIEVDMARVVALRAKLKPELAAQKVNLTYLAFIARATVDTLLDYPWVNGELRGQSIVTRPYVNLGIAVALDEGKGLIVPVIRNAQDLNLTGTARAIQDIAERARTKKLLPDDVQGGTFTITNPGSFGTFHGTPIINQPQSAILGTYALVKRPWVIQDDMGSDVIAIRPVMNLTLTYDHRLVDGAYAGMCLRDVRDRLESWDEAGVLSSLEGSCLCGGVRFEVTEPFVMVSQCHCEYCKRISGGYGTVSGRVRSDAIRILEGDRSSFARTRLRAGSAKTFCSTCGSNLFGGGWPESEMAPVRLSTLGLDFDRKPEAHTFVRSVAAWEILPDDGLPRYEIRAT